VNSETLVAVLSFVAIWLRMEHRLTKVETKLDAIGIRDARNDKQDKRPTPLKIL